MKITLLKIAILTPLIPVILFIVGLFILSYIEFGIMIFNIYANIF